jgi:hypothetical protein
VILGVVDMLATLSGGHGVDECSLIKTKPRLRIDMEARSHGAALSIHYLHALPLNWSLQEDNVQKLLDYFHVTSINFLGLALQTT